MEIFLEKTTKNEVSVACEGVFSHHFLLSECFPDIENQQVVLKDPVKTGKRLFAAS